MIDLTNINACVINLPERIERLERTHKEICGFFGDNFQYNIVNGIRKQYPQDGIAEAHLNCIKMAKDNNWENVLIMEDDVWFQSSESRRHADKCMSNVPDDFDIISSGCYTGTLTKYNEYWSSVNKMSGLHFYIVNNKAYDKILKFDYKLKHIDMWLANKEGANLRVYVPNIFFGIQYDGFSDNSNKITEYNITNLSNFNLLP